MIDGLAIAIILAALALAAWAFISAARDRTPDRAQFVGLAVIGGIMAIQSIIAVVRLVMGAGPDGAEKVVTLIGYLLTAVLVPPAGAVLARMEPTRYGSALVGAACLVLAILVVRLQQVWG